MALDRQAPLTFLVAQRLMMEYPLGQVLHGRMGRTQGDNEWSHTDRHSSTTWILHERFLQLFRQSLDLGVDDEDGHSDSAKHGVDGDAHDSDSTSSINGNNDKRLWDCILSSLEVSSTSDSVDDRSHCNSIIATSWIPAWLCQDIPDIEVVWRLWDVLIVSPPDGIL
jgi:hypothetical protein